MEGTDLSELLDTEVVKILDAKIGDQVKQDLKAIKMEADKIYADFARRGALGPMTLRSVADMCCEHIKKRSENMNHTLRELSERGVLKIDATSKEEVFNIIKNSFVPDLQSILNP
jgi:hypothetical protein